ncbi:Spy/CpxP family protein refolding chaperone [Methylorubrum rhodinum]|uniref:Spy/CpxP family protein refolding chaperone n=1 Tax=Methylorubrum rhodinum TaxID=29428 RepID=A0A840ZLG3_9HYPH|nr:hypothetical protein [Methylorubrum rhodinum]MBB5757928.1 Spy/CpxP family protein refolding chaperone [Methylorubrum rhodinum]
MKTRVAAAAALVLLGCAPALAMRCCGGPGKAAMCAKDGMGKDGIGKGGMKGGMAMSRADKGGKGCCCEGMSGRMSRRG